MPEVLKYVPIDDIVLDSINKSYMKCEHPDLWNISISMYPTVLTDFHFADAIALLSNTTTQARQLLLNVESECKKMGLCLNSKKTKVMAFKNSQ